MAMQDDRAQQSPPAAATDAAPVKLVVSPTGETAPLSEVVKDATDLLTTGQIGQLQKIVAQQNLQELGLDEGSLAVHEVNSKAEFDTASQHLKRGEEVVYHAKNGNVYEAGKTDEGATFSVSVEEKTQADGVPELDTKVSVTSGDGLKQTIVTQEKFQYTTRASLRTMGQGSMDAGDLTLQESASYTIEGGGQSASYSVSDAIGIDGKKVQQGGRQSGTGDKILTDYAASHSEQLRKGLIGSYLP